MTLPEAEFRAYLVAFYRSSSPGQYVDAGVFSEEHPTMALREGSAEVFHGADKSQLLLSTKSRRSYQRALDALLALIDERATLWWVKDCETFQDQAKSRAAHPELLVAQVVLGRDR